VACSTIVARGGWPVLAAILSACLIPAQPETAFALWSIEINRRENHSSTIVSAFSKAEDNERDEIDEPVNTTRSIGAILMDAGRMVPEDAERVLRYQREHDVHFGEAAVRVGVATAADIEYALSQQFDYPYLVRGESPVDASVIAAYDPFTPEVEALRALRTQLLIRLIHTDRKRSRLAIVSPEAGDGRSYLAANLAVVFSQLGEKTLLIDADLRNPRQHQLFGVANRVGLSSILSGRVGLEGVQRVQSMMNLSLLTAGPPPPNPQELLGRPMFTHYLDRMSSEFNIVIIDTPPGTRHAESLTIASRAGAAVVVARRDHSRLDGVRDIAQSLSHARVALVGAVLNEF